MDIVLLLPSMKGFLWHFIGVCCTCRLASMALRLSVFLLFHRSLLVDAYEYWELAESAHAPLLLQPLCTYRLCSKQTRA